MKIKKAIFAILMIALSFTGAYAQNLISSRPAHIMLFGQLSDGTEVTAESRQLTVIYDPGWMKGELPITSLSSTNPQIRSYLEKINIASIRFEVQLEGSFDYGNSLNQKFTVEAEIFSGECRSKTMMNFLISYKKTKDQNTFLVICTGELSLFHHFGLVNIPDLSDKVGFQYTQNVSFMKR